MGVASGVTGGVGILTVDGESGLRVHGSGSARGPPAVPAKPPPSPNFVLTPGSEFPIIGEHIWCPMQSSDLLGDNPEPARAATEPHALKLLARINGAFPGITDLEQAWRVWHLTRFVGVRRTS